MFTGCSVANSCFYCLKLAKARSTAILQIYVVLAHVPRVQYNHGEVIQYLVWVHMTEQFYILN